MKCKIVFKILWSCLAVGSLAGGTSGAGGADFMKSLLEALSSQQFRVIPLVDSPTNTLEATPYTFEEHHHHHHNKYKPAGHTAGLPDPFAGFLIPLFNYNQYYHYVPKPGNTIKYDKHTDSGPFDQHHPPVQDEVVKGQGCDKVEPGPVLPEQVPQPVYPQPAVLPQFPPQWWPAFPQRVPTKVLSDRSQAGPDTPDSSGDSDKESVVIESAGRRGIGERDPEGSGDGPRAEAPRSLVMDPLLGEEVWAASGDPGLL